MYDPENVAKTVVYKLLNIEENSVFSSPKIAELVSSNAHKTKYILVNYEVDPYKNILPKDLKPTCICGGEFSIEEKYDLSHKSIVTFDKKKERILLFARDCKPDSEKQHFIDIIDFISRLTLYPENEFLMALNLHQSGASIPQHFHCQFIPLEYKDKKSPIRDLFHENIKLNDVTEDCGKNIIYQEILSPVWGLKLSFKSPCYPEEIGNRLYECLYRLQQYSQRRLNYNLLISSRKSNEIYIFFRYEIESPFSSTRILNLIEETIDTKTAKSIGESKNQYWRWGFLEACLGFLPPRDNSFHNIKKFSADFWDELYRRIGVSSSEFKDKILESMKDSLGAS